MAGASAARLATVEDSAACLFDRIRDFLLQHRLSPDPQHYAFAHRVLSAPDGTLARSVRALTDDGVRLSARDIEALGGTVGTLAIAPQPEPEAGHAPDPAEALVARTQMQVEGFTDMVEAMRAETQGFGRDLAATADAMRGAATADNVVRLTSVMLDRVQSAEAKLAAATHEADELRAKLEEARDNARRDPLTDLPNRRAFEEAFAADMANGVPLCLAVVDVDRFKRVNDQFGHSVGDRVLKAIAEALSAGCAGAAGSDRHHLVARYGGEEFVVLFRGIDPAAACLQLEAAREAVAAKRYRLRESDQPLGAVTFSGGLTPAEPGEPLGTVFGRADILLYGAKDAGRNRVHRG